MAAVRSLRISVKPEGGSSDRSESESDSDLSDRDAREPEPMEVEEGELEREAIPIRRDLKELLPDTSRRYENKAGTFITGIDVTSKEAVEKKEKRAQRFHFCAEVILAQRNVVLDRDTVKTAIPRVRLEALYVSGVDDMSTQDIFGYFKEYPPAHIEWIDDTSCNVVWLDDVTSTRALLNVSRMPDPEVVDTDTVGTKDTGLPNQERRGHRERDSDEEEDDGEVDDEEEGKAEKSREEEDGKASESEEEEETKEKPESTEKDLLSQAERDSLLRNDPRPATKPFKGNKLFMRFATKDDKKVLGAARRSQYYIKYGNPNYGGMRGIISNSWKRRFHTRRIQRDVLKTKKPLMGDSLGHTPPYTHRHSADLVNLPEEPIEEEEEEEGEEDMDSDDRVVEFRERGLQSRMGLSPGLRSGSSSSLRSAGLRSRNARPSSPSSSSDEMDYDLELKMISTPSPKKSMKMTMYADEVETNLKSLRHAGPSEDRSSSSVKARIGSVPGGGASGIGSFPGGGASGIGSFPGGGASGIGSFPGSGASGTASSVDTVTDVRQLLEEKRQGISQPRHRPPVATAGKMDVRQRLGKRPYSPERRRSASPLSSRDTPPRWEPITDVRSRLGVAKPANRSSELVQDKKTNRLWSRLGPSHKEAPTPRKPPSLKEDLAGGRAGAADEEDYSQLQKAWGAAIEQKEIHKMKKSRLDNLPSLQIEISQASSDGSDS